MTDDGTTAVAFLARATFGGRVIATTTAAVRVDGADVAPILWFPRADVDASALDGTGAGWWRSGDGRFADHVAFDHEQVDLELIDLDDVDAEPDPVSIRFPNWGDAAHLIDILDVRADGEGRYVSGARSDWRRPVVEASQILGQALVAAGRHAPGRRAVSAAMVFPRAADAGAPYVIELDEVAGGRTFSALTVRATQGTRTCGVGTMLLDVTAADVIRHAEPAPTVAGPRESTPYDMGVTGRDLRIVDDAYTGDPDAPLGPPVLDAWVRFRSVPDDQPLHAGLLAQFCGHLSIAAAMRPHAGIGQDQAHRTLSTGINAISLSIHAEVRADRWMRYHHRSTFAGDGMTHSSCRVYDEGGSLLASFTVDAMVRAFADPTKAGDARTAL